MIYYKCSFNSVSCAAPYQGLGGPESVVSQSYYYRTGEDCIIYLDDKEIPPTSTLSLSHKFQKSQPLDTMVGNHMLRHGKSLQTKCKSYNHTHKVQFHWGCLFLSSQFYSKRIVRKEDKARKLSFEVSKFFLHYFSNLSLPFQT